MRRGDQP
ncbi:Protein of unknown function [Propionibacterium freudenreichii]|nr:Protein of unknown function [Propionibacterium freudenreichii subsp. freudenreichii]CEG87200.1 Protein of unknown function [Propionibacterium freudenreichii]CEG92233.1 Protein of unknown function [Propionibacterium freudenreichii]CEG95644.1 Protein of unknown function [Propionibacterium freudenreichii]CEH00036.1 Protein of unknown function [Propionibacterium freudenreichii]